MIIFFNSNNPCEINLLGNMFELNSTLPPIKIETNEKEFIVHILPILTECDNNLPYSVKFTLNGNILICKSSKVVIIDHGNNTYEVTFLQYENNNALPIQCFNNPFMKYNFLLHNYNIYAIKAQKIEKTFNLPYLLKDAKFEYKNNCLVINAGNKIVIINEKLNIYTDLITTYKIDGDKITLINSFNDYYGNAIVKTILLDNLEVAESYIARNKNNTKVCTNPHIIPYVFSQCAIAGNYSDAKTFLSENLNSMLKTTHLKAFFEGYTKVIVPRIDNGSSVALLKPIGKNRFKATYYKFDINNGKIENIEEL